MPSPLTSLPPDSPSPPIHARRAGLFLLAVAAAGLLSTMWRGPAGRADAAPLAEALPVESFRLTRSSSLDTTVRYPGVIEASRAADMAFERPGRVVAVLVDEGQVVARGQLLARLDTADLEAQLRQAQSQLAQAEAGLRELRAGPRPETIDAARAQAAEAEAQERLARTQAARRADLLRLEAISREEMDSFRTQVDALAARAEAARQRLRELATGTRPEQIDNQLAQVALARGRIQEIGVQVGRGRLLAPFAGRVAKRHLDEGAYVGPGTPVVKVIESGPSEIRLGLPADIATGLAPGQTFEARLGAHTTRASVLRLLPVLDDATRVVAVQLALAEDARAPALPGMLAEVEVPRRLAETGFRVPTAALTRADRGLWACFAVEDDPDSPGGFRVKKREVEVLHSDDAFAFVRGLIDDGDRIVASGVNRITDGQRVTLAGER